MPIGTDGESMRSEDNERATAVRAMGRSRNEYIDLLRALAICPVLLVHWLTSGLSPATSAGGRHLYEYLAQVGPRGVPLFFVISGFVITRSAIAREGDLFNLSYRSFYPRRIARIFPLLALACAIGIAFLWFADPGAPLYAFVYRNPGAVFDAQFWVAIATFTFNIWRIENLPHALGWGLNWDVLWSLAVEEQFYILFPLILFVSKNRARLRTVLILLILTSIDYRFMRGANYSGMDSLVAVELLGAGVLAGVSAELLPPNRTALAAILGGALLGIGLTAPLSVEIGNFYQDFIALGAALSLSAAFAARSRAPRLLRPMALLGELSYGMYLLHPTVLFLVGPLIARCGSFLGYVLFAAATTAVAAFSYHCYEKPTERAVRKAFARLPPALSLARQ